MSGLRPQPYCPAASLAEGCSQQAADRMHISVNTIRRIFEKRPVRSKSEAVSRRLRRGDLTSAGFARDLKLQRLLRVPERSARLSGKMPTSIRTNTSPQTAECEDHRRSESGQSSPN